MILITVLLHTGTSFFRNLILLITISTINREWTTKRERSPNEFLQLYYNYLRSLESRVL